MVAPVAAEGATGTAASRPRSSRVFHAAGRVSWAVLVFLAGTVGWAYGAAADSELGLRLGREPPAHLVTGAVLGRIGAAPAAGRPSPG